jgi:hypothetical protein
MAFEADALRREAGLNVPQVYVAKVTPHLAFDLAVPVPDGALNVPQATLATWGVTVEQAFAQARENDAADLAKPWLVSAKHPGLFRSPWQDTRDGARMMSPRAFSMPLRGQAVALLPTPSTLLVAGSEDEQGLVHVAEMARATVEREKRLHVLRAFQLSEDGAGWEDWMPPRRHGAYRAFRLLEAMQEQKEYAQQAELVEAVARAKGADAMPLPRLEMLVSNVTGEVMTVTAWRGGRPTALPKADTIVLRRGAKTLGLAAWDDLLRAVPGVLEQGPGYPTRYLALDFPEDWQLAGVELRPWRDAP